MAANFSSKHGQVSKCPEELFMIFTDLRNFAAMVPEKMKSDVTAEFDYIRFTVQGFAIAIRVDDRQPYNLIRYGSSESPVEFVATLHFDRSDIPGKTDFWIEVDANLNFMMKSLLGSKIQQGLDKAVESLVAVSNGEKPDIPSDLI